MAAPNIFANINHICCIGAGRLGAFSMLALANHHPNKTFIVVDEDADLITDWNHSHTLPFSEPGLHQLVQQRRDDNVFFDQDVIGAIQYCRLIFVAVEMRTKKTGVGRKGQIEVSKWERMIKLIRDNAGQPKYIIDKSSVPFEEKNSILTTLGQGQYPHEVYTNPEFFIQGSAINTLLNPPRVIFGSTTVQAPINLMHEIYYFAQNRVEIDSTAVVNFAKIFRNGMLGCMAILGNIASTFADDLRINVYDALRIVEGGHDRLGHGFLIPNVAVGGPAIQRDIAYLAYMAEEKFHKDIAILFKKFIDVNIYRKNNFVKKIHNSMTSLKDKIIVVIGFSFKEGTEDVSDSPAIHICKSLLKHEITILRVYDPLVHGNIIRGCLEATHVQWNARLQTPAALDQNIYQDADAICVMTREPLFLNQVMPPLIIRQVMRNPSFLFDLTGIDNVVLDNYRGAGFQVYSSGRPLP